MPSHEIGLPWQGRLRVTGDFEALLFQHASQKNFKALAASVWVLFAFQVNQFFMQIHGPH